MDDLTRARTLLQEQGYTCRAIFLTHAHDDDLVTGVDGLAHGLHCLIERIIQRITNDLECINFVLKDLFTANDMADHSSI